MKDILEKIMADSRYQKNIQYGKPRAGHPEGKIKFHIEELGSIFDVSHTRWKHKRQGTLKADLVYSGSSKVSRDQSG